MSTEDGSISLDTEEILPPPSEAKDEQPQTDVEDTQDEQVEGEPEEGEDLEDYEFEGKKARIPKEWRDALMKNADYTQKTQALAEERRAVEARREEAQRSAEFWNSVPEELVGLKGKLATYDDHLEQWRKVDFNAVAREHGEDYASAEYRRYMQTKDQRADLAQKLEAKGREVESMQSQETARRLEETAKHAKTLKGWTPDVDKQLAEYVEKKGISREQWLRNASPQLYEILYDAFRGAEVQKTVQTKTQPKPPQPAQAVPPSTNRAAPTRFDPAKANMDDYIANFQRRMKAGRK